MLPSTPTAERASATPLVEDDVRVRTSEFLLVGPPDRTEKLSRALQDLTAVLRPVETIDEALHSVTDETAALVLSGPTVETEPRLVLERLGASSESRHLPVFVVVDEGCSPEHAHELYAGGATVVFEWPAEVLLIPHIVAEMLDVTLLDHKNQPVDESLTETVQAHIDVDGDLVERIQVEVSAGIAVLTGSVDSVWKKRRLVGIVSHVPGIRAVQADEVEVRTPRISDAQLQDAIEAALGSASEAASTLVISVNQGVVTVAGTTRDRAELERIENVVENTEGVNRVQNLATVSPEQAEQSRAVATHVAQMIREEYADVDARVSVFGKIVVLTGRAPHLGRRRQVERAIEALPEVDRVVNKLATDPPGN